jgi:RNA polymerase sigma-70 factor (ECF subfamily)
MEERVPLVHAELRRIARRHMAHERVSQTHGREGAGRRCRCAGRRGDRALASIDRRKSQVVEMCYFGGLSIEETAEALGVSVRTVKRDWTLAKLWLVRELRRQ